MLAARLPRRRQLIVAAFAGVIAALAFAAPARADDDPAGPPMAQPTIDAGDLWRKLRHKDAGETDGSEAQQLRQRPFAVFAPSVTSKPTTGLTFGLSGSTAFVVGDPEDTRMSVASAGMRISMKKQVLGGFRFSVFSPGDRWFVQGDNRFQWTSLNVYAAGVSAAATGANLKYDWVRAYETVYRSVAPGLFVGGGVNVSAHRDVRPNTTAQTAFTQSEYLAYSTANGYSPDATTSSGLNASVLFDTRDNSINARRGWLADASYRTFFNGFLGGDSSWQQLSAEVRTYRKLTSDARHRLAFWALGDFVAAGSAPFLDLPMTAGDLFGRSARGYGEGRYRGPHLVYGETEYRGDLTASGLIGMVAFLNVTTVDSFDTANHLFRDFAPGAGLGLRVLLDKHSRTNLCADYGFGRQGSRGFYLSLQEAF